MNGGRMKSPFLDGILVSEISGDDRPPSLGEIGLNHFAPYLINLVSARWTAKLAEQLKSHNMTTAQMRALAVLSINSGQTINDLAALTISEQSTMSRTLDVLEEQGFIERRARPEDMRVRKITITDAGRAAFAAIWPMMFQSYEAMFKGIDSAEYFAFLSTLQKILRNMRDDEF
jgi:MarR family transcriptional regulator, transcriptional regulator for hemolysin